MNFQVNFLQNNNVKLESENILLRREIENLHRQLYQIQQQQQSAQFRQNQTHIMQDSNSSKNTIQDDSQQETQRNSEPYQHIENTIDQSISIGSTNHMIQSYHTPSGVLKEINYDHKEQTIFMNL